MVKKKKLLNINLGKKALINMRKDAKKFSV